MKRSLKRGANNVGGARSQKKRNLKLGASLRIAQVRSKGLEQAKALRPARVAEPAAPSGPDSSNLVQPLPPPVGDNGETGPKTLQERLEAAQRRADQVGMEYLEQNASEESLDAHRRRPPAMPPPADGAENHDEDFLDEDGGTLVVPVEIRSSDDFGKLGDAANLKEHATDAPDCVTIIPFRDTAIVTFRKSGRFWAAINSFCEELGVEYSAQCSRLEVVREFEWREFTTPDAHKRESMFCVAAEQFNDWIAGIDISWMDTDKALKFLKYRIGAINLFCDLNRYPKTTGQPVSLDSQLRRLESIAVKTYEGAAVMNRLFMQFMEFELMREERAGKSVNNGEAPATAVNK